MANPTLQALRDRFKKKTEGKREFTENNDVYPHWNIDQESIAVVRILRDADEDNENFFYVDKLEHKLTIDAKDRKIPCMKMFGEKCPICELSSKYYKAEGKDSVQGKYYYFKRTSLMKALIIKDPINKDGHENAVGQVKTLQLTYQLMNLINEQLASEDEETALEHLPWDIEAGYNFNIKKTAQGKYDNYTTGSGFARKVSAVAEEYLDAVEAGAIVLSTLLPKNPGLEKVQALLEAHLTGESVDESADEAEEEETPVIRPRKVVEEDAPAPRASTRKVVEAEEEEEEEEAPVIRRTRKVVEDVVDDEPVVVARATRKVVEEVEEEEAPVVRRATRKVVEEVSDEDDGNDDPDDKLLKKLLARSKKGEA